MDRDTVENWLVFLGCSTKSVEDPQADWILRAFVRPLNANMTVFAQKREPKTITVQEGVVVFYQWMRFALKEMSAPDGNNVIRELKAASAKFGVDAIFTKTGGENMHYRNAPAVLFRLTIPDVVLGIDTLRPALEEVHSASIECMKTLFRLLPIGDSNIPAPPPPLRTRCAEIESWLAILGGVTQPSPDPEGLWQVDAQMRPLNGNVGAYVLPTEPESLVIETSLLTDEKFEAAFERLNPAIKSEFQKSLEAHLQRYDVEYTIGYRHKLTEVPNAAPVAISFRRRIPNALLTMSMVKDALIAVSSALDGALVFFRRDFDKTLYSAHTVAQVNVRAHT